MKTGLRQQAEVVSTFFAILFAMLGVPAVLALVVLVSLFRGGRESSTEVLRRSSYTTYAPRIVHSRSSP